MGCDTYRIQLHRVSFSESNDDWGCLCTFPHNDGHTLSRDRVASLALLGATVVLLHEHRIDKDYVFLPDDVPQWIQDEIIRIVGRDEESER